MDAKSLLEELQSAVTTVSGIVSSEIPACLTPTGSANLPEVPSAAKMAFWEARGLTCCQRGEDIGARGKRVRTGRDQPQLSAVSDLSDISRTTRFRPQAAGGRRWERIMRFVLLTSQVLRAIMSDKYLCVRVCGAGSFPWVPGYGGSRFIKPALNYARQGSQAQEVLLLKRSGMVWRGQRTVSRPLAPHSFGAEVLPLRSVRG